MMVGMMVTALFITVFLFLWLFSLLIKPKHDEEHTPRNLKVLLIQMNGRLKSLLIRKNKPTQRKDRLEQKLSVAGIPMKAEEFMVFQWFATVISGGVGYLLFQSILFLGMAAIVGYLFPSMWLRKKQRKRIQQFNDGLPGMITSIIGSLRAGFSFPQSLQMVSEESYSPMKEEVELVLKSMKYGTSMEDALIEWKNRMPSEDLGLLVEAILIQRQVGGNLAYLLDKIVETTRERTKIENQIKTLTAQGRLSGVIISLLPVALGGLIYIINPGYISTLFVNPIGQAMLAAGLLGGIIGFILIRKITTIEV